MKVGFVLPSVGRKTGEEYVDSWKMEPLTISTLAGLTPEDVETIFYDDRIEPIDYNHKIDLAAINVETYTARRAYEIADEYRKRGIPVIMGGFHATLVPLECSEHAEAVLIGEAEGLWSQVIEDARNGTLRKTYFANKRPNIVGIRQKRDIYRGKKYLPITLVESARGCKYSCGFCSISSFYKSTNNARPVSDIVAELQLLGKKMIFFVDDNINSDFTRAKELYQALTPLKINWFSQSTIGIAKDEELLTLMKQSGCLGLLIGFESLNKDNLKLMGKQWNNDQQDYKQALKTIHDHGIIVYGTFVFGYDFDTAVSIEESLEFAINNKLFLAAFNHLVPFPGTKLYADFERDKRLLYDQWWLKQDYHFGEVAFKPKLMSPEELADACFKARKHFYNYSSIFTRSFALKSNSRDVGIFAKYISLNLFSKREISRRQGLPLGAG